MSADRDDAPRVARALEQVRAGVRQSQAEQATLDRELAKLPPALARLHEIQYVEEPQSVSHRPVVGRVIVFVKQAVYQAFMKWFMSSVIEQQNAFNRTATEALRELAERQRRLAAATQRLDDRLAALEGRRPDERA
jgi:hypothetical protein